MTVETVTTLIQDSQPAAVAAHSIAMSEPQHENMRTPRDFRVAKRHSVFVSLMKLSLPVCAFMLAAYFIISSLINFAPSVTVNIASTGIEDGKVVMNEPKMTGLDKNKRPFEVNAVKAIQDTETPDIIALQTIAAKVPMDAKSFADINAKQGVYNSKSETLVLREDVQIKGARGMDISLQQANIDIATGAMVSDSPVVVTSPDTNITADSVEVAGGGKSIKFKNRVKMTIKRPAKRGTQPTNQ